jgi:hypothetical protein
MAETHAHFHQAPDETHNLKALGVGFLALVLFGLATMWGLLMLRHHSRGQDVPQTTFMPAPQHLTPEVGMVFQWNFDDRYSLPPLHRAQTEELETYGWVNPAENRIYMPVSRAIELYLAAQHGGEGGSHPHGPQ